MAAEAAPIARPPGSAHLSFTMAALSTVGGVAGYARAGSVRSLGAGVAVGAAFAYAGSLISTPGSTERGLRLAAGTSAVLTAAMAMRFARTRAVMPAGALTALGAASLAYHGAKWQEWAGVEED